jgi:hypothetical protein
MNCPARVIFWQRAEGASAHHRIPATHRLSPHLPSTQTTREVLDVLEFGEAKSVDDIVLEAELWQMQFLLLLIMGWKA